MPTDTEDHPAPPPPPPPPPPPAPLAPRANIPSGPSARAVGEPPSGGGGGRKMLPVIVASGLAVLLFSIMLAMCGGGEDKPTPPPTTLAPGANELTEVNPLTWWPEVTPTASELIGKTRDARLVFARQANTLVSQGVDPCDLWIKKDVFVEVSQSSGWSVNYPVPAFECPRSPAGAFIKPATAVPGKAPAAAPTTATTAAVTKPAGE